MEEPLGTTLIEQNGKSLAVRKPEKPFIKSCPEFHFLRKRKMKRYLAMTNNPCYNVFIL